MTSYSPRVQCQHGKAPPTANCKNLLDTMMTSGVPKRFGKADDPQSYVTLPKYLSECQWVDFTMLAIAMTKFKANI